ncbi:MAG: hypothetical protein AAF492_05175, partial [Verrucomicrobiota bacterium]
MNRKQRLRRRALQLAGFLLLGFLGLNLLAFHHARAMFNYKLSGPRTQSPEQLSWFGKGLVLIRGVHLPKPVNDVTPEHAKMAFENHRIKVGEDTELAAWHIPRADARGMVVLFHGYSTEKSSLLREA